MFITVALTSFRRNLGRCRLWVRELTHTLSLPLGLADVDGELSRTWLLEVLEYLPKLQSLLVSNLPFFDHNALTALGSECGQSKAGEPRRTTYNLRLLSAAHEINATVAGLCEASSRFSKLVYLDLSYTTAARDHAVLTAFSWLSDLQALKLRGIGLRDMDVAVLVDAIGTRVRLLDLRNNQLSDDSMKALIQDCFLPSSWPEQQGRFQFEWRLPSAPFGNVLTVDSLKNERLDEHLAAQLIMPLDGNSAVEDIPHVGITHLYVADNKLSEQGLFDILGTCRLYVLDAGTVQPKGSIKEQGNPQQGSEDPSTSMRSSLPIFRRPTAGQLTYLRISHVLVTGDLFREILPQAKSAQSTGEGRDTGTLLHEAQNISSDPQFETTPALSCINPLLHERDCLIRELLSKRPSALGRNGVEDIQVLHPSDLPKLRTLVLTNMPSFAPASSSILTSLKRFITSCGEEALLASLQAQAEYSLPPGGHRQRAEKQHAKSLFALERLVLEVTTVPEPHSASAWVTKAQSKSSTGDKDSENLWTAAMHDFSFFGAEESENIEMNGNVSGLERPHPPSAATLAVCDTSPESKEQAVDLVKALAAFRKDKREAYKALLHKQRQTICAEGMMGKLSCPPQWTIPTHVEGHWEGEVRIVKNLGPRKT